jgi:proline iminopeptidase
MRAQLWTQWAMARYDRDTQVRRAPVARLKRGVLTALALCFAAAGTLADDESNAPGEHTLNVQGVRLWYRVAGAASGTPVVFLHGGPGEGSQTFAHFAGPALEAHLHMVYLDQRGSGRSDRPKDPTAYSIMKLVDDIEALRQQLDAPRIDLIGHSFGTILGLEYAARYPDRVAHLVLAASVPDLPRLFDIQCQRLKTTDPAAYARAAKDKPAGSYPSCDAFNAYEGKAEGAFIHRNMYPKPEVGQQVDAMDAADGLGNTGELGGALAAQGLWSYRFDAAAKVTAPVLVIAGGQDLQAVEAPQQDLVRALPHARLLVYPRDGHFMFVEHPERFARDVTAFMRQ